MNIQVKAEEILNAQARKMGITKEESRNVTKFWSKMIAPNQYCTWSRNKSKMKQEWYQSI